MRTFGGEFTRKQKVSLSGKKASGIGESREEILERTRLERERRKRKKLENETATLIQSAWRSYIVRGGMRGRWRRDWCDTFGSSGELLNDRVPAHGEDEKMDHAFRRIVMCVDPWNMSDVSRLATVCLYLNAVGWNNVMAHHGAWFVRDIFQLSLRCLSVHCQSVFQNSLQKSYREIGESEGSVYGLVLCVMGVLSCTDYGDVGPCSVSSMKPCLRYRLNYRTMVQTHVFDDVAFIVESCTECGHGVTCAETLLTNLLVFSFSHGVHHGEGILRILSIDGAFERCSSLEPLAGKLWASSLEALAAGMFFDSSNSMHVTFPGIHMGYVIFNLVQCLKIMASSGKGGKRNLPLGTFMKLVETELGRGGSCHVDSEKLVQSLADVDVVMYLITSISKNAVVETQTLCSFVNRLLLHSHDAAVTTKILVLLAVRANLAKILWKSYLNKTNVLELSLECHERWIPVLTLFCECFATSLQVLGDESFYVNGLPVPVSDVYEQSDPKNGVLYMLKELLWKILWNDGTNYHGKLTREFDNRGKFLKSASKLLTLLHDRNGRRPFAPQEAFYASNLPKETFYTAAVAAIERREIEKMHVDLLNLEDSDEEKDHEPSGFNKIVNILQFAYPLVPFLERVRIFQSIVQAERRTIVQDESMSGIFFGGMSRERFVTVQRGRVLEDAYSALGQNKSATDVKKRIRISFVNEFGETEAGIDGGGVFKEFLECVVKESTSSDMGLFNSTMDNKLYPAPMQNDEHSAENLKKIEFVGLMIGKAVWEGILLELSLAPFFLKKIRGATSGVDDLPSLDPEMAKNLSYLIHNPDNISDMGLTFSITESSRGMTRDVELIPGGSNIPVTAANAAHFVHRIAYFKLNEQIEAPCDYFLRGFHAIIPKEWVSSFNDSELQMLIGGAEGTSRLDLDDLRRHVVYTGGYTSDHPVIGYLWEALNAMTNSQLSDFLRFVTSCPRPPILGFGSLEPPLTIQMAGTEGNVSTERLPTAATCVNLLKLPPYDSTEILLRKLLYSIEAHAGFDLS